MTWTAADRFKAAFITVLGSGFAPIASGSWGSLASVLLFLPLWYGFAAVGGARNLMELFNVAAVIVACYLSILWGRWAIQTFGRKDPKQFVLDEFAGQWIALLFLPIVFGAGWWTVLCVFGLQLFLFRVFDVLKVPPAAQLERLPEGWGILLDDLVAGMYANVVGQLFWRFTPAIGWLQLNHVDFIFPEVTG
ncbi:MAG: phosphatidylglycerophosphatase A [Phycisphaerae bacterium]